MIQGFGESGVGIRGIRGIRLSGTRGNVIPELPDFHSPNMRIPEFVIPEPLNR